MNIYVVTHDSSRTLEIANEIDSKVSGNDIFTQFDINYTKPTGEYVNTIGTILQCEVLVCEIQNLIFPNCDITRAVTTFASSLDTMEQLGVHHTPKIMIGIIPREQNDDYIKNRDSLCNIGAFMKWGVIVPSLEEAISQITGFIKSYPL
jgi:hypothetical protein